MSTAVPLFAPLLVSAGDPIPNVPSMVATRLRLELLLQEMCIDLNAVAQVILADPGATLQILRLIGEEYPCAEDRPTRIEDCIASLSLERWYEAVCASCIPHKSSVLAQWQHFRLVAQFSRELAQCVDGFSPEEAYLVGLLHQLGKIPNLLGWERCGASLSEQNAFGVMLADHWHLPAFLVSAIAEQQNPAFHSHWGGLLQMAQLAAVQAEQGSAE